MLIYLITFVVSYICAYIGNKQTKSIICFLFLALSILIPSFLAGYRDETVGYDLLIYAVPCFNTLCDISSVKELSFYISMSGLEPMYVLFNFIVTRFTDDIFWAFFLQQVIVLSLITYTCYRLRNVVDLPLVYLSYLLFYFCNSMTANRQVFAVAIVFFSFYYIIHSNLKKFIICIVIATLFHNSAVFTVVIFFLYKYAMNIKGKVDMIKLFYVVIIGIAFYMLFPIIINSLITHGLINSKYERYMNAEYNFHKIDILIMAFMYVITLFNNRAYKYNNVLKLFIIVSIFIILCGQYNDVATRMAVYFNLFIFVNISRLASISYNGKSMMKYLLFLLFLQYFYLASTTGFSEAIPYTSKQLGI